MRHGICRVIGCLVIASAQHLAAANDANGGASHESSGVPDCAVCHASESPTAAKPGLKPCPAPDGVAAEVKKAPDMVLLDQLATIYAPVQFNHKAHAQMSAMNGGCADCHHENAGSEILACVACHGETPDAARLEQPGLRGAYHRQCLSCHRAWSHENGCGNCHSRAGEESALLASLDAGAALAVEHGPLSVETTFVYETQEAFETKVTFHHSDHTRVFGLDCAACHQEESCAVCHESAGPALRKEEETHATCVACHEQAIAEDCTLCHGEAERPRFDHAARSGFDTATWHGETACGACHTEPSVYAGLEGRCGNCHAEDWQPEAFDHARTGMALDTAHAEIPCAGCHTGGFGTEASCVLCHEAGDEAGETVQEPKGKEAREQTNESGN